MAWMAVLDGRGRIAQASGGDDRRSNDDATDGGADDGGDGGSDERVELAWGFAKTASFLLPPALCELVLHQNMELGRADDVVFRRVDSKRGSGTVGALTNGEIDRMEYYVHALKLALIPWIRPELYLE